MRFEGYSVSREVLAESKHEVSREGSNPFLLTSPSLGESLVLWNLVIFQCKGSWNRFNGMLFKLSSSSEGLLWSH